MLLLMKSPFTGKEMELRKQKESVSFRGEDFSVLAHFYYCEDTKEEVTTTALDTITLNQLYNQYRAKYSIPSKGEIRALRKKYALSSTDMSEILGFGTNTYSQYENGQIPSRSNGKTLLIANSTTPFIQLVKLANALGEKKKQHILKNLQEVKQQEERVAAEKSTTLLLPLHSNQQLSNQVGYKSFSLEKVHIMVSYFAQQKPFTTKLNKLLFYADFGHYKQTGFSISGISYKAIKMGPVPLFYNGLYEYLNHQKWVEVEEVLFNNGHTGNQYYITKEQEPNLELLEDSERATLEQVYEKFKDTSTKELIDLSHEEQAWQAHQANNEIIDYTHAFYLKHL